MDKDKDKLSDQAYLRDLAARLMNVPVTYGTDQYDVDRLCEISREASKRSR